VSAMSRSHGAASGPAQPAMHDVRDDAARLTPDGPPPQASRGAPGRGRRTRFRRLQPFLTVLGWTVVAVVPLWILTAMLLDEPAADLLAYAAVSFGIILGLSRPR
jgi:hypothetical protein